VESKNGYWVPNAAYAKAEKGANMNVPNASSEEEWNSYRRFLRPVMISLVNCKNVLLQGVIFQNSPAWNIHPLMCENIIIDDVLARNPSYAQNGDALDLESCKNALIVNSKFDAGDDGICIKSGKDADGRRRGRPCENVVVDGCTVFAGHGGFVVGSEMSGGVKNILVENCQFLGTDVGLRFKSTRGRGGIVENIFIDNVSMTDIKTDAITFNMYYGGKSVAEMLADGDNPDNTTKQPVTEETPIFRNIDIKNIICNGAGRAMEFNGLPEMPINGIRLQNIQIQAKSDAVFNNCQNIKQRNVHITVK
jgi:polygalacturonase